MISSRALAINRISRGGGWVGERTSNSRRGVDVVVPADVRDGGPDRRDKSNPLFSAWQPVPGEQWPPSRHSGNKTSSNHDPSPSRKPSNPPPSPPRCSHLACPPVRPPARPAQSTKSLYKCNETVTGAASSITPPTLSPLVPARLALPARSSSAPHIRLRAAWTPSNTPCRPVRGNPVT
jgi:hypothetical protein